MSDIDLAVRRCKKLETLLAEGFNATGRGLHEKVSSAGKRLPVPLVKQLRYIATVRNRIVHEEGYTRIDNRAAFERACDEAEQRLIQLSTPVDTWTQTFRAVAYLAGFLLVGAAVIAYVTLSR